MKQTDIAKQLGSRGGKKTLKKYGKEHFREMVNKRWAKVKAEKEAKVLAEKATAESLRESQPSKDESFFKPR